MESIRKKILLRYRLVLGFFIIGLIVSGITAFPLLSELKLLARFLHVEGAVSPEGYTGLQYWILTVYRGLEDVDARYPWMAYGTDWLAFAHLVIAVFFVGSLYDPVRNEWVLVAGLIACILIFPLAFICGAIRGIPFYWRLIDCSFGLFGMLPLLYCRHLTRKISAIPRNPDPGFY